MSKLDAKIHWWGVIKVAQLLSYRRKHPIIGRCMICEKGVRAGISHTCKKFQQKG